jgi:hypothetical protein
MNRSQFANIVALIVAAVLSLWFSSITVMYALGVHYLRK